MSSLIKKPCEITSKTTIAALIYGQSGMGKTTLACSAPKPVLFDFDGGISRIRDEHQVPCVQIKTFKEAQEALAEVEAAGSEYETIIIDTASKMVDSIVTDICGTAQPKIQQWGLVNAAFKNFLRSAQSIGKNIVFIAQREVEKDGEVNRYVPQFRASNYKDVICDLDVCGYMEMVTSKGRDVRQITFNPTSRNEGKNTAQFQPAYILPELAQGAPNRFLTERFAEYAQRMRERDERRNGTAKEVEEQMQAFVKTLEQCDTPAKLNAIITKAKAMPAKGDLKPRMSQAISEHAKAKGYIFDKATKTYSQPKPEPKPEEPEQASDDLNLQ